MGRKVVIDCGFKFYSYALLMGLLKPSNYLEFEFPCRGVGTYLCVVRPSEGIRLAMQRTQVLLCGE